MLSGFCSPMWQVLASVGSGCFIGVSTFWIFGGGSLGGCQKITTSCQIRELAGAGPFVTCYTLKMGVKCYER